MSVIRCPHCGKTHRAGARFCSRTGKTLNVTVRKTVHMKKEKHKSVKLDEKNSGSSKPGKSPAASSEFHCPSCGKVIKSGKKARFCNFCGFQLEQASTPSPPREKTKRRQCPYSDCEGDLNKDARFCSACYRRVRPCRKCGHINAPVAKTCKKCGKKMPVDSADWPMFKGNPQRTGITRDVIRPILKLKWSYPDRSQTEKIFSSPIVYKGLVYYGSCDFHLHALNQYNGSLVWKRPTNGYILSTPAVWEDVIYVASCDGKVYAQDAQKGKPLWVYPKARKKKLGTFTAPLLACNLGLVAVNDAGQVYCLDLETGSLKWKTALKELSTQELKGPSGAEKAAGAAFSYGKLYIPSRDGRLHCLQGTHGHKEWVFPKSGAVESRFVSTPAMAAGHCYISDRSGKFYAVEEKTGDDAWQFTVDLDGVVEGSPSIGYGKIVVGTQSQYLVALNLHAGGEIWRERNEKIRLLDAIFSTPTLTMNRLVFVGSNSGYVYCRDLDNGDELWKYKLDSPLRSSPVISDGFMYMTTTGGMLYAFCEKGSSYLP